MDGKERKNESIHRSYMLSFLEVVCDLKQHTVSTIGNPFNSRSFGYAMYEIQISNNRKVFSKEKAPYIIYDSKCMECNSKTFTCSQKVSFPHYISIRKALFILCLNRRYGTIKQL